MEENQSKKCCVAGCNSSSPSAANVTYHSFPAKLELSAVQVLNEQGNIEAVSRHEAWKRILQLKQPVTSEMTVCSRHFKGDEFQSPDKSSLTRSAIPTLNLPPVPAQKSLRIRSDKDLMTPLKLKDPLSLSPTDTPNPVTILNQSIMLPSYVKFGPDTASKSPIGRAQLKRAVGNSADSSTASSTPSQPQSSPVPAKRPRVAAIENRNQSPAAPQVFFVGVQANSEASPVIQTVKERETVQPSIPTAVKSPTANPILFLKQVPKPMGVKLMRGKNVKLKAIITDKKLSAAPPLGQQATQLNNIGEKTAASSENPPKVGNSGATVGEPSSWKDHLKPVARKTRKFRKGKRVICLSSDGSDPDAAAGAARQKAYRPVKEYCAFINCATYIDKARIKVAFPSEPATQKVWLERAGIRASLPEDVVQELFVCDKHFKGTEFSPWDVLKPGILPWSYRVYNDSSAIDGNPHWVQKKVRANLITVADNSGTIEPVLDACCIRNCPRNSDNTTVLHPFPAVSKRVTNLRVAYQIQKLYGDKKICKNHLSHQFFKNGIFNASAAVLLGLQLLWVDSDHRDAEASHEISGTASEVDVLEDSEQEDSLYAKVYVPVKEYCAFINCATHASEAGKKLTFPLNQPMRHSWSVRAGIPSSFPVAGLKLLFVCEKHFTEKQFTSNGGVTSMAVPTNYRLYPDPAVNSNGTHWWRKQSLTNCVKAFSTIRKPKVTKCCIENCLETSTSLFPPDGALGYLVKLGKVSRAFLEYFKKQKVCDKHLHHKFCDEAALSKASEMLSTHEVLDQITNEALTGDSAVNAGASPQTLYKPMRQYCAIINCATHVKKAARKFPFPTEKNVLNAWRIKAGIPSCVADEDLKMLFICANHFNKAQFSKWGTLLPGSVPEDYKLYRDPLASDSQPHWLRKKRLTHCSSKIPVVDKCAIKECTNSSKTTQMCPFPSLTGFIKQGSLSKNVISYYENKKICSQHLKHNFFKHRLLNHAAIKLLDLIALSAKPKQRDEVVWQLFPSYKAELKDMDFYGDVKGKAVLRKDSIEFPHIQRELQYSEDPNQTDMFRYRVEAFTEAGQTATEKPRPGKRVQVHTALIIDDDCEKATIERIRKAFEQKGKLDFLKNSC